MPWRRCGLYSFDPGSGGRPPPRVRDRHEPRRLFRMRVRAEMLSPGAVSADVLAVPIYREDREFPADLAELDSASGGVISAAIDWGEFNILEHYTALIDGGTLPARKVLLLNGVRRGR